MGEITEQQMTLLREDRRVVNNNKTLQENKPNKLGKFIVIEGIDGCGTSTQVTMLKKKLNEKFIPNHITKEPTDGPAGVIIRMALRHRIPLDSKTFTMFFATDRYDHLNTEIIPNIEKGINVICDRYYLSSYAYQSLEEGIDLDWVMQLNAKCLKPDLNIVIDVPAKIALKRKSRVYDYELELFEKQEFLEKVRRNFKTITEKLKNQGQNIEIIDGCQSKTTISDRIWNIVKKNFGWTV